MLLYPALRSGDEPVSSLRLENLRDGIEDADLARLVSERRGRSALLAILARERIFSIRGGRLLLGCRMGCDVVTATKYAWPRFRHDAGTHAALERVHTAMLQALAPAARLNRSGHDGDHGDAAGDDGDQRDRERDEPELAVRRRLHRRDGSRCPSAASARGPAAPPRGPARSARSAIAACSQTGSILTIVPAVVPTAMRASAQRIHERSVRSLASTTRGSSGALTADPS